MVCDKCQTKLNRVICPEVAKKPIFKQSEHTANKEESKGEDKKKPAPIPLYKRRQMESQAGSGSIDFSGITTQRLDDKTLSSSKSQREKSGMNMALLKGMQQKRGFDPTSMKCRICKMTNVQKEYYYCQKCSYSKGICAMCGKKILDISMYKQKNI